MLFLFTYHVFFIESSMSSFHAWNLGGPSRQILKVWLWNKSLVSRVGKIPRGIDKFQEWGWGLSIIFLYNKTLHGFFERLNLKKRIESCLLLWLVRNQPKNLSKIWGCRLKKEKVFVDQSSRIEEVDDHGIDV